MKTAIAVFALLLSSLIYTHTAQAGAVPEGAVHIRTLAPGAIRITPDETRILRLDEPASSVIVANPFHAEIMLDSPRTLVIMPRQPGTTMFTVLNSRGGIIMKKNIIVAAAAQPGYVRIRRACSADDLTCNRSTYYYCPDGCYEVAPVAGIQAGTGAPPIQNGPAQQAAALTTPAAPVITTAPVIAAPGSIAPPLGGLGQ